MTSKELINKAFDKRIKEIKEQKLLEEQTDKNITEICKKNPWQDEGIKIDIVTKEMSPKERIGWDNPGIGRVSEELKAPK